MKDKEDYKIKGSSIDICFCVSDCKDIECDRNIKGGLYNKLYNRFTRKGKKYVYTSSDLSIVCKSYKK